MPCSLQALTDMLVAVDGVQVRTCSRLHLLAVTALLAYDPTSHGARPPCLPDSTTVRQCHCRSQWLCVLCTQEHNLGGGDYYT
jgi:hypothetical protein